jgi:ATP-dependent protease HslVU (ClpYQ) peptidase subunit
MTTVVCVTKDGKTVMASDSAGSNGSRIWLQDKPKIVTIGDFTIGNSGSIREANIIEYEFSPLERKEGESDEKYIYRNVNQIKELFEKRKTSEKDHQCSSKFLIHYKGKVYEFDTDFQFMQWKGSFHAIGSGSDYALGAMAALITYPHIDALDIAVKSIGIAAKLDPSTALPIQIVYPEGKE